MFLKDLIQSKEQQRLLLEGLSSLYRSGYFSVALELAVSRAGNMEGSNVIERAAIQRGFIEGYKEALMDLFYFNERYIMPSAVPSKAMVDYGATSSLISQGILTKEEADEFGKNSNP